MSYQGFKIRLCKFIFKRVAYKQDLWAKGCGGCRRARSKPFSNTQEMSNNIIAFLNVFYFFIKRFIKIIVVIWLTNILKSSYPRSIICQNCRKDVGNSNLQKQMTWTTIYKVCNKMSWIGICKTFVWDTCKEHVLRVWNSFSDIFSIF